MRNLACVVIFLAMTACGGGSRSPIKTPTVDAGPDLSITLPEVASLQGSATSYKSVSWSKLTGPGQVSFEAPQAPATRAAFSAAGTYTLDLTAVNGPKSASDQVQVAVGPLSGTLLVVDPSTTYQTITGWEATTYAFNDSPAFPNFKDHLYDEAVNDLGINRVRLEVRSGVENVEDFWTQWRQGIIDYPTWRASRYSTVNDNADPSTIDTAGFQFSEMDWAVDNIVLPLKSRVETRGEQLWINVNYVAFTTQIGPGLSYIHDDPDEYAEFVEATWLHLDGKYGWVPDSWEVILEPDNVSQWNGTLIGQAIVAAATRLEARGYTPVFVAPSNTNMGNAITYFDALAAVPGAAGYLKELSYHRYGGVSDTNLQTIQQRAATWGIETAHLEWIGATYRELYKDLALAWNSSWSEYVLAGGGSDDGGKYYVIDDTDPANPIVNLGSRAKFLRQTFRFVRRGAVRVEVSAAGAFEPLAFVNADGRNVVVVNANAAGTFYVQGLAAGTYGRKYTTASEYDIDLPDVTIMQGEIIPASIPDTGVITLYAR